MLAKRAAFRNRLAVDQPIFRSITYVFGISPLDRRKNPAQLGAALGVYGLNPANTPLQMTPKIREGVPILSMRPEPHAIMQDRFEIVVALARHIEMLIYDQPGQSLTGPTPHDARLAAVQCKSFVARNRRDQMLERLYSCGKGFVAGEGKIIGVTAVIRAEAAGEARKALVKTPG